MVTPYLPPTPPFLGGTGAFPRTVTFSYQEGEQLVGMVERLRKYLVDYLAPFINDGNDVIIAAFDEQVNKVITDVNTALTAQTANVDEKLATQLALVVADLAEQLSGVDSALAAQLADVAAQLVANVEYTNTETAAARAYVDAAVASIINSTIAVTDPVMVAIDGDPATAFRIQADARKVTAKNILPANVKDFGAIGDGVSDDTAAIQSALNTPRDVYLPPGTYRVVAATGFALNNTALASRRVYGAGIGATLIKLDSGGEGGVFSSTGATLSDLAIDGGFDPATAQSNLLSCVQANSNSVVRDCYVYNSRGSALVGVGSRIAFINNRVEKFGDHAIYFSGNIDPVSPFNIIATSTRLIVTGNIVDDTPSYHNGVEGGPVRGAVKFRNNVSDVLVSGNTIAGDICITIDGDNRRAEAVPRRIVITGNTIRTSYSGVTVNTGLDAAVTVDTGIRITDVVIDGNTFTGTDTANSGVSLQRARASITGNLFTAITGNCVDNQEIGDYGAATIIGNTFRNSTTGVYKAGTGSLVQNNLFENLTGYGVYANMHHSIVDNNFTGCAIGVTLRSATHATLALLVQGNSFVANTTGMDVGEFSRSVALLDNTFTGNTASVLVASGSGFNGFTTANNRVISGGAFPSAGSSDSVALAPVTPVLAVAVLPVAASPLRGRMLRVLGGVGVADQVYICRKNAADAYEWAATL